MRKFLAIYFVILVGCAIGITAVAADLPVSTRNFQKTYVVDNADEAFTKFQQSRVLAGMYFKTENLKYSERIIKRNGKWKVIYTWRKL